MQRSSNQIKLLLLLFSGMFLTLATTSAQVSQQAVYVNSQRLSQQTVQQLSAAYNIRIQSGRYWYDKMTGAWGHEGGPTLGYIMPWMQLGGPLKANASNGNTNVFVNGRELHHQEVAQLRNIMTVIPGRYWLDAKGNGGPEGRMATFNLVYLLQQANRRNGRSGGSSFYRNSYTGIGGGSSGGTSYVIGKDFSVIVGN